MKMNRPEMEVIKLAAADVIATSYTGEAHLPAIEGQEVVFYPSGEYKLYDLSGNPVMWVAGDDVYTSFMSLAVRTPGVYEIVNGAWIYKRGVPSDFHPSV